MERTIIRANSTVAFSLMNSLCVLYMAIVEGMGGNPNDPDILKEGEAYARKKFVELADEFEDALPMQWRWVINEEDDN